MKTRIITLLLMLWTVAAQSQGFRNPVLPGFHADPSVCRAGDDYYLVNSTFQYFPGVPVFHSKDLIHWEQIGACLTRKSQVDLTNTDALNGIYAPTIRYNDGMFYMVTTVYPSRRHFYVYTDNPAGEWSDPIYIDFSIGSCDPTLFFDDGHCYFLWKNVTINICEIDIKSGRQLSEVKRLWSGLGGRYPEGPHLYKKDGYYYLMLAEGGTEHGHHVNIARSEHLYGPYEPCPANPILSHFNCKMQNSSIQGLGHADFVQAADSTWWMICLGYRTHGYLQHVMGRETFLAPVRWDKGAWPVVNRDGTLQIDMDCPTLPQVMLEGEPARDDFSSSKLPWHWFYINNPDSTRYSLTERKGYMRLRASASSIDELGSPTFIGRRQVQPVFSATALIDITGMRDGDTAGITAYAAHTNHYDVRITSRSGKIYVQAYIRVGEMKHLEKEIEITGRKVYLRISSDQQLYHLYYSVNGKNYIHMAEMGYRYLSTETIGGFTGVLLGLFAQSEKEDNGYIDVDEFVMNND
jgi:alpha-N-arabinofuranosidase